MAEKTYLFYDVETSGLSRCFDQVLQFAAIRTDLELNELERYELFVKLNPDTIPAPQAIITHGLSIESLANGLCEYEAIKQIHTWLNTPGTISIGYNNLGFDDELLRFSFYRNLLDPYTHQYANNCSRMDLYPITLMYHLFKPETLVWPKIDGKTSLRLENLNSANQLATGNAHNAMVDVLVTLALAKKLQSGKEMWDYVTGFFDKSIDTNRCNAILTTNQQPLALMCDGAFGSDNNYQWAVLSLGQHLHYRNQSLWLRLDTPNLTTTTLDSISTTTQVARKRFGEPPLLLPPKERFMHNFELPRTELVNKNIQWLMENPKLFQAITAYYQDYKYPDVPNVDIDAALYLNGFLDPATKIQITKFHNTALDDKSTAIAAIKHETSRKQALRILARNYPQTLTEDMQTEFNHYLSQLYINTPTPTILDYRGQARLSLNSALIEINNLLTNTQPSTEQIQLLLGLQSYLQKLSTS